MEEGKAKTIKPGRRRGHAMTALLPLLLASYSLLCLHGGARAQETTAAAVDAGQQGEEEGSMKTRMEEGRQDGNWKPGDDDDDDDEGEEEEEEVLRHMTCSTDAQCEQVSEGTFCHQQDQVCRCKPDYPVTDTFHCYKDSKHGEFCRLDVQCQRSDEHTRCNRDLNVCQCQPRFDPQQFNDGTTWCIEVKGSYDSTPDAYWDPALFGIMGGLALMFIVMCVVLQLFARAQFRENRTIFNTPNPRLMNVSLMKDIGRRKKRNSDGSAGNKRQSRRRESIAAAATAALHVGHSSLTAHAQNSDHVTSNEMLILMMRTKLESVDDDYDCRDDGDAELCEVLSHDGAPKDRKISSSDDGERAAGGGIGTSGGGGGTGGRAAKRGSHAAAAATAATVAGASGCVAAAPPANSSRSNNSNSFNNIANADDVDQVLIESET